MKFFALLCLFSLIALAYGQSCIYTVQSGDTLSLIASKFGTSVSRLCQLNKIADPNRISIGQRINYDCNNNGGGGGGNNNGGGGGSNNNGGGGSSSQTGSYSISNTEFQCMFPRVSYSKVSTWVPYINSVMAKRNINTYARARMFLAQTGHESAHYDTFTEYTKADGTNSWCGNYDGGCTYRGRGAIQLTGASNYKAAGKALGQDFYGNPPLAAELPWAFETAGWYWEIRNLNACSDANDVYTCTKKINGGTNGLQDRERLYDAASECLHR